tara:strand:- start:88 stop:645 length:558 start_codon:yes stop_codon:yes gene_type:complete
MMMMFSSFMLGLVTFALSGGIDVNTPSKTDAAQAKADAVAADPNSTPAEVATAQAAADTNSGPTPAERANAQAAAQEKNQEAQVAAAAADTAYKATLASSSNPVERNAAAAAKAQADFEAAAAALAADPTADATEVAAAEEKVSRADTLTELGCERCHMLMHCPSNECFGCYSRNLKREGCPQTW